jgi:hypothetical protein
MVVMIIFLFIAIIEFYICEIGLTILIGLQQKGRFSTIHSLTHDKDTTRFCRCNFFLPSVSTTHASLRERGWHRYRRIELTDHFIEGHWVARGYPYETEVPESRLREGRY